MLPQQQVVQEARAETTTHLVLEQKTKGIMFRKNGGRGTTGKEGAGEGRGTTGKKDGAGEGRGTTGKKDGAGEGRGTTGKKEGAG